ncbi:hypothetical protein V9T40_014838 [Parthenolecanium corni]|uniref:Uncharacterized protein n=1 Tax=Parthenolecanium corni TaxID=536013 RepID=A0AAN9XWS5_9HEMI
MPRPRNHLYPSRVPSAEWCATARTYGTYGTYGTYVRRHVLIYSQLTGRTAHDRNAIEKRELPPGIEQSAAAA